LRPYSPGGTLPAFAPARKGSIPPTPSVHRLRRGLPGYLIRFAPHALAPQRQPRPSRPPSPPVFRRISTHFTTTPGIPSPSTALQPNRPGRTTRMSPAFTQPTDQAAYAPFTPSESGQRLHPPYYRGCWHGVSRCLFLRYRPSSSLRKEVYNPKAVLPHAASLRQAFAHCARSLTAATRRCLGRVPVPVWPTILSDRPPVTGSVGRYPTDYLMGRGPPRKRLAAFLPYPHVQELMRYYRAFPPAIPHFRPGHPRATQPSATMHHPKAIHRSTCMFNARRQRLS
jgi:hypothetical protein